MKPSDLLRDKRILVVDDEPDIIETLEELLSMCRVDAAQNYESAKRLLAENQYDAAIFDIMGVDGYALLESVSTIGIPALMLTAHALSPEDLVKSLKSGAHAYIPKEKMFSIEEYLADVLAAHLRHPKRKFAWYAKLEPYFDSRFKPGWKEKDKAFWRDFEKVLEFSREELEDTL
jgi:DNA-binding response OmpR family regulator